MGNEARGTGNGATGTGNKVGEICNRERSRQLKNRTTETINTDIITYRPTPIRHQAWSRKETFSEHNSKNRGERSKFSRAIN